MTSTFDHGISKRLDGVRAAITGGTSGLGLALVGELLSRGACVAFVARTSGRVDAVAREHPGAHGIVGDVARKEDIHPIALQMVGNLGGLDVLVNGASSLGPVPLALLADTECEDFELALATNVLGPFRLTRALLGALGASAREGRGSVVVNVSSDAAISAYPMWGAYGASKAALQHMSRIWDEELSVEGIRFLSLDPGDMDTALHAAAVPDADPSTLKRPETAAHEIADAIAAAIPRRRAGADPSTPVETACEGITRTAETAETAEKTPGNSRRALRALRFNVAFFHRLLRRSTDDLEEVRA
jgi:NAD(P)-dependent dehydrogenase (short-subunit alcohol dehydrogenase family)